MAYMDFSGFQDLCNKIKAWTAAHYEPKIVFNDTPVYSVTLAEDVELVSATDYTIELSDAYTSLIMRFAAPAALNRNGIIYFDLADSTSVAAPFRGQNSSVGVDWALRQGNVISAFGCWGQATGSNALYNFGNEIAISDSKIEAVRFVGSGAGITIPSGTIITIYGAQEV